ncbi:hypothetical protein [Phytoactinopolyspora limicola]|uniref:hypothetical protein n=1 Tax=Phytoactinopolyspora limicola TaxID=2715536 RepID=UPI00140B4B1E|nr:hypothetical protein [Phytoactinopolyspora limicola]
MGTSETEASIMVPNPLKTALERVLTRASTFNDELGDVESPITELDTGATWTGSAARRYHDDVLKPLADDIRTAAESLAADVEHRLRELDDLVPEHVAIALQVELSIR